MDSRPCKINCDKVKYLSGSVMVKCFGLLLVVILLYQACKKDTPEPEYPLSLIAGSWRPVARMDRYTEVWKDIEEGWISPIIKFRYDGLQLNENNKANCCWSSKYTINGIDVQLEFREDIPRIDGCDLMLCQGCYALDMSVEADTLVIYYCENYGYDLKLVRN